MRRLSRALLAVSKGSSHISATTKLGRLHHYKRWNLISLCRTNTTLTGMSMHTTKPPKLFTPYTIRSVTFPNRIGVSPMCQYSYVDGFSNEWQLVHLGSRAVGKAGIIIVEATAVEPRGRISPADLGIWKDEHIDGLKRVVEFCKSQGSVIGIQLAHSGRKGSTLPPWEGRRTASKADNGWDPVAPSAVPFDKNWLVPRALAREEIHQIVQAFAAGAERAMRAGFDFVEIHGAHGYLIHQFLSPLVNFREDEYGGSADNRMRFALEVASAVRAVLPHDTPLWLRLSATDWVDAELVVTDDRGRTVVRRGWCVDDAIVLAKRLAEVGVDVIDCSSGGAVPQQQIREGPLYQVPFSEAIRRAAGVRTAAVGQITTAQQANAIVEDDKADFVLLAREMLRSPYWALTAAAQLGADIPWPKQYERAKPRRQPNAAKL